MVRSEPTTVLTALGFSARLDRTYQRLRAQSGRELVRIASTLLRTPEELLEELQPLIDSGVVRLDGSSLSVASPAEVVSIMAAAQSVSAERAHRRLDGISSAITLLAREEANKAGELHSGTPLDGELATSGEIYEIVRSLVMGGRGELLWLRPDQWRAAREARMTELVAGVIRDGRPSRAIYPVRALYDAPERIEARIRIGEQIRVLPELTSRLLVVGDTHAMLPEPLGYADVPLSIVRQRGVVEAMTQWFEMLWERAAAPTTGQAGLQVDPRRFLVRQLAAGARDEQIARMLGTSLRTVRRRVAELMNDLGADSRFQAGVEAARRGWL